MICHDIAVDSYTNRIPIPPFFATPCYQGSDKSDALFRSSAWISKVLQGRTFIVEEAEALWNYRRH